MPEAVYFIDPITEEQVNLNYEKRSYPFFVSNDGVHIMQYSKEEDDWIIIEASEIKYRWKTNWPLTGTINWD